MVKLVALLLVLWTLLPGAASAATLMVSPVSTGEAAVSLDYAVNQVRYQVPTNRFYVSRDIYAASWLYESFFASVGYIGHTGFGHELSTDDFPPSGEPGYLVALGARGAVWRSGDFGINLHIQLHGLNEKVIEGGVRYAFNSQEVLAGVTAAWQPPGWRAYAGLDVVPYSNVDMDAPGFELMERSDFIIGHFGGGVDLGPVLLSADFQVVGTEGMRISLGYAF
jgi:hypothetical protein